ncbi:sunset domain-containing protein [Arthrobacter sp. U41]|uniref:sunset domain-containing protein n=1 Tax=Arthrobacter sp. U41 TaxID=1849032 RepID=UPI0008593F4D|nr:hypothetical protein [Arthrobacter sp. U41]AOT05030.1 hypothetical protein ASPU41_18595 [Arthrobacter sp. U41]
MDWIIWLVVIVAIVAVVWWLLNRNSSRDRSGAAGTGTTATHGSTPAHADAADHEPTHRGALSGGGSAASASAAGLAQMPAAAGFGRAEPAAEPEPEAGPVASPAPAAESAKAVESPEWETQWSETPQAEPHAAVHQEPGHSGAHGAHVVEVPAAGAAETPAAPVHHPEYPVHHPEYTEPHAPTLPGAESAAAEAEAEAGFAAKAEERRTEVPAPPPSQVTAESPVPGAETRETAMSSAASETAAGHLAEPAGHLAVDQPYGEGSAAPAPDGSGPEGFSVKGVASSMVYHDETSPAFEETRAEVWFLSAAHAEAAGFRPPRRTRQ